MTRKAAAYVRISDDPNDERAGVTRQRQDCAAKAESLGWEITQWFEDNDVSAYRRGVVRPAWQAMLEALKSRQCDALVAYDLDRLTRQPRDLEDLIDLVMDHNIPNAVVTGDVDLSSSNGQLAARLLVSVANKSSADTARRVARARRQKAEKGTPSRSRFRPYGYDRDWSPVLSEVAILNEIFERVASGEGLTPIANDLNSRGVPTTEGKQWRSGQIRNLIVNPLRIGKVTYRGEVVADGQHGAIVPTELFVTANEVFAGKAQPAGHNARKHLLAGFLVCTLCGHRMTSRSGRSNVRQYSCKKSHGGCGHLAIVADAVESLVISAVLDRLINESYDEGVPDHWDAELADADTEVKAIQAAYESGDLALVDYVPTMKVARAHLTTTISARSQAITAVHLRTLETDPEARWERVDLAQRRSMVAQVVESVAIRPGGQNGGVFDPSRVEIVWKP